MLKQYGNREISPLISSELGSQMSSFQMLAAHFKMEKLLFSNVELQEVSVGGSRPSPGMHSLSRIPIGQVFLHGCNPTPTFPRFTNYLGMLWVDGVQKVFRHILIVGFMYFFPLSWETSRGRISSKERLWGRERGIGVSHEWWWYAKFIQVKRKLFWRSFRKLEDYLGTLASDKALS